MRSVGGAHEGAQSFPCTHCHASVGHGAKAGLGGPLKDTERAAH
jgi:hypothetical protein